MRAWPSRSPSGRRPCLCNGRGHYEEALDAASDAVSDPNNLWFWGWAAVELIEAASRTGNAAQASPVLERLAESTDASGSDWALAIQARCRALLSEGKRAESLYQEALERLLPNTAALRGGAYPIALRRVAQATTDGRKTLGTSFVAPTTILRRFGMSGFADRAGSELLATGERARKRTVETGVDLTPQEMRISELASQGAHQSGHSRTVVREQRHG